MAKPKVAASEPLVDVVAPEVEPIAAATSVPEVKAEEQKTCIACKELIPVGDRFCMHCGVEQVANKPEVEPLIDLQAVQVSVDVSEEVPRAASASEEASQLEKSTQELLRQTSTVDTYSLPGSFAGVIPLALSVNDSWTEPEVDRPCVACKKLIFVNDTFCKHCGAIQNLLEVTQDPESIEIDEQIEKPPIESSAEDAVDAILFAAQREITPFHTEAPDVLEIKDSTDLIVSGSGGAETSIVQVQDKLEETVECVTCSALLPPYARYCLHCGVDQREEKRSVKSPENEQVSEKLENLQEDTLLSNFSEIKALSLVKQISNQITSINTKGLDVLDDESLGIYGATEGVSSPPLRF